MEICDLYQKRLGSVDKRDVGWDVGIRCDRKVRSPYKHYT